MRNEADEAGLAGLDMRNAMMARIAAWELLASAAEPDRATPEETSAELWDQVGRYRKVLYDLLMSNMITARTPSGHNGAAADASRPGQQEAASAGAPRRHDRAATR